MSILKRGREGFRRFGFDLVRFPHPNSLGAHIRILFPRLGIDSVLDVGGHRGEYARFLRRLGYLGTIHTFEPVPASFEDLVRKMGSDQAWTGHPLALGARNGEVEIRVMRRSEFSSIHEPTSYAHERFGDAAMTEERIRVPMRRLDTIFDDLVPNESNGPTVFLKLDTQGSELAILEGAGERLARVAAIQAELPLKAVYQGVSPLWEALPQLRELGFEPTGFFPISIDRNDLTLVEVDCVAIRKVPAKPSPRTESRASTTQGTPSATA